MLGRDGNVGLILDMSKSDQHGIPICPRRVLSADWRIVDVNGEGIDVDSNP